MITLGEYAGLSDLSEKILEQFGIFLAGSRIIVAALEPGPDGLVFILFTRPNGSVWEVSGRPGPRGFKGGWDPDQVLEIDSILQRSDKALAGKADYAPQIRAAIWQWAGLSPSTWDLYAELLAYTEMNAAPPPKTSPSSYPTARRDMNSLVPVPCDYSTQQDLYRRLEGYGLRPKIVGRGHFVKLEMKGEVRIGRIVNGDETYVQVWETGISLDTFAENQIRLLDWFMAEPG